jgi:NTP pyrophosphatase (non-canonical NTP hydrolase)
MDVDAIKQRMSSEENIRLLHVAMGLCTEAGEFMDAMKKHIYYGSKLDKINLVEESGDTMWYLAIAADVLQTTFAEIKELNIDKLKARFPEKFTQEHSEKRNLKKERKILEGKVAKK